MGFRFSRRVSILPGLRLNLSGSGVSLSAGVRAAHVTFSPHGTYGSVGIPGTGLSYRQRLDSSGSSDADARIPLRDPATGRRLSQRQVEARIRAADTEDKIQQLKAELQDEAAKYRHLLEFWHPLPDIPSQEDWVKSQNSRPFEPSFPPPAELDWPSCEAALLAELTEKHHASGLSKLLPGFVARHAAEKEFPSAWTERENQLQAQYNEQWRQYQDRLAKETQTWNQLEANRVAWVQRLLADDLEEVHNTVDEVLMGLQLPFQTHCDFFLLDPDSVYLHLNLPLMEETIPVTRKEILQRGDEREVRRPKDERNTDYTRLATGTCLYIAAEVLSYLPLAKVVQVAAYTQRPRAREADPVDTYVLDVAFPREAMAGYDQQDPGAFMVRLGGRMKMEDDGGLGRIEAPSWLAQGDQSHLAPGS